MVKWSAAGLCARVVWGWHLGVAFGGGIWGWHLGVAFGGGIWGWHLGVAFGGGIWGWRGGLAWAGVVGARMGWAWGFCWVDSTFLHAYKDSDAATPLSHLYLLILLFFFVN